MALTDSGGDGDDKRFSTTSSMGDVVIVSVEILVVEKDRIADNEYRWMDDGTYATVVVVVLVAAKKNNFL